MKPTRNSRWLAAVVAAILFLAGLQSAPRAQGTLTITFPSRLAAGPDYATDVLKDSWDFSNAEDVGPDPGETVNWTNFGVSGGLAGGTASSNDAQMSLLFSGYYVTNNPGKNGVRFPIDSSRYKKLAVRMSADIAGETPQVHWFHTTWLDPADEAAPDRNFGTLFIGPPTVVGFRTFVVDLTAPPTLGVPWTNTGVVRGLRLDPNGSASSVGKNFFYDWARLTLADTDTDAAIQRITWSGGSGTANVDVIFPDSTTLRIASGVNSPFDWNYGILPPGSYTLRIARTDGSTNTRAFTINNPPSVHVTDPSRTSGQDYATTVHGNPWDMSGPEDIVQLPSQNIEPDPPGAPLFAGGLLTARNTNQDPNITLVHNNNNALGTKAIDTAKYRYLTYRMSIEGPVDIGNGSVARVLWGSGPLPNSFTTTRDIIVFAGMQSYTLDLATFPDAPAGGIEPSAPGGSLEAWTTTSKTQFRFDPHEFGTNPGDPTPTRKFQIDDIKLTARPVSFGSYTIRFAATDADADPVTVNLYYDTDLDPREKTPIVSDLTSSAGGAYVWNTSAIPPGTYNIYAEALDGSTAGFQTTGSYSDAPLVVSLPCTYTLSPTGASVPNTGGSGTTTITAGSSCDWTAASNSSFLTITSSAVGTGNGTISFTAAANPARTARTGTLTIGGQTFTVTQLATRAPFDFDGDGRADRTVFTPGTGIWRTQGQATRQFGLPGDLPVPGDYNGDGVLDTAVYRPPTGDWFIQGQAPIQWGRAGDVPMPADYDGDGRTETAVFRTSDSGGGVWYVRNLFVKAWGLRGDIPLAADFDGDRKADLVAYRPATGQWFVTFSAFNYTTTATYQWGVVGDIPVTGDFDGDGKADLAAFRPATGEWFITFSSSTFATNARYVWGIPGDIPLALDMDGDRVDELVVYRRSDATWWTFNRISGGADGTQFGTSGDLPAVQRPQIRSIPTADFDGDRRADFTVFRPSTGQWFTRFSSTGYATSAVQQWGLNGDVKVPGDYDGDGKIDLAVYRPSNGIWFLRFSSTGFGTSLAVQWGLSSDIPLPADYDGDGSTDLAVFRPSTGEWFLRLSASDYATFQVDQWGLPSDIPVPADYDGDGKADLAVYRPSNGQWFLKLSSGAFGGVIVKQFGLSTDTPVPSDWDGDGRADLALHRPSTGQWFGTDALTAIRYNDRTWGIPGDTPIVHDFDFDGVMDSAVFRPSTGEWFVKLSSTATGTIAVQWGVPGDQPLSGSGR